AQRTRGGLGEARPRRYLSRPERGNLLRRERRREQRAVLGAGAEQMHDVVHALAQIAPVLRTARGSARRTRVVAAHEASEEGRRLGAKDRRHGTVERTAEQ